MKKKKRSLGTRFLVGLNILFIIPLLLSYLAPFIPPDTFWPMLFLGMAYPYLLIINLCFLGMWCWGKKKQLFIPLAAILIGWFPFQRFFGVHYFSDPPSGEKKISVITYNIHNVNINVEGRGEAFIDWMENNQPDILCLQEFSPWYWRRYFPDFYKKFPINTVKNHERIAIFSKHPIIKRGYIDDQDQHNVQWAVYADINIEGRTIRAISTHLQSNRVSGITENLDDHVNMNDLDNAQNWNTVKSLARSLRENAIRRAEQARILDDFIRQSPHPVILCGDFNDPPETYTYRRAGRHVRDAFASAGTGWGVTYQGTVPLLRIDYIFSSPSLPPSNCFVLDGNISDHRPVRAEFVLESSK